MNNIEEIKGQNQFDCFIKMYTHVANEILDTCGTRGERAVRNALQKYGEDRGKSLRKAHREQGIKTNLSALMAAENCCGEDPRFFRNTVDATQQVQLWEVYSCPLAHMWRRMKSERAGSFYCEECVHSIVKAYTGGKGQANLSDRMTCERDTYCRFSLYYRPSNLDEEQKNESFGPEEAGKAEPVYVVKEHFIKLYYYLLKEAAELLGQEGINAVAGGLRRLAKDMEETLKIEADHVGRPVDREFLRDFFPVETEKKEALWEEYASNDARNLLMINLIRPLENALNL